MEIEPVDVGMTRAQRHRRHFLTRVAAPTHARPRPRAKRHAAVHRRGRHRGEHRRLLRPAATRRSSPQAAHRNRANPPARHPHRRKSRNSCSTNRGSPSPSRSDAACARKVSKWSRTIPYKMVDVGSRGSYALDGCATRSHRRPTCQHTGSVNQAWVPRSRQRGRDSDNCGCHRLQIDSSAGGITGRLFGVKARSTRQTLRATAVTVLARRLSREQPESLFV